MSSGYIHVRIGKSKKVHYIYSISGIETIDSSDQTECGLDIDPDDTVIADDLTNKNSCKNCERRIFATHPS
jgi:hypothetical protein